MGQFFRWPHPMVLAIAATIGAAGLVLYLQHHAISTLQSQTEVILRQISEQTAADIAVELHRTLDGPVFDTLTAVNHPDLRAGRLDLVAQHYQEGLTAYPQVDRFLAWNDKTEAATPGEVLFYGRDGGFSRDPDLGRAVIALAKRYAPMQQIHIAAEHVGPGGRYDVFLRLFWSDARRLKYFAILGFVVEPTRMREQLFGTTRSARLEALLSRHGGDVPLQLRVTDENGAFVYGTPVQTSPSARVPLPMLFYPVNLVQSRLAARVEPRMWTIEVAAAEPSGALDAFNRGYWPTALSVALMLVALGLTVQAHRRSAELARMQTDFVAHVSHQLKTPLSLLSAATETLQMDRVRSPKKLAAYLDTIHAEAARLSALVQRVLEFSRVQEPRSYEFEQVDLGALVRETVAAFARGLPSRRLTFEMQHDGPGPFARADPAALEQVLANLLDNAAKYSDESAPITVRLRVERGDAVVDVVDAGLGIAPADRTRIFERFYRGSSAASQRPGFGLGLPIVRELIRAQGGQVTVSSEPGAGSTFSVRVPRSERGPTRLPATRVEPEQAAT